MRTFFVGLLTLGISTFATAEDASWYLSDNPVGNRTIARGMIEADSGHVYNRGHTLPGDPGFEDNIYEIRVSFHNNTPLNILTAWLFCLDENKQRIGGERNAYNEVMGNRLDATIGGALLADKIHVGYFCGLPTRGNDRSEGPAAEDVAFVEVVVFDHGRPVRGTFIDDNGVEMPNADLQLNRPEEDPFCTGKLRPRRNCKKHGYGIVSLHRHPPRDVN